MPTDLRICVSDALAMIAGDHPAGFPSPFVSLIVNDPSIAPPRCVPSQPHPHLQVLVMIPPVPEPAQPDGVDEAGLEQLIAQLRKPGAIAAMYGGMPPIPAGFCSAAWAMGWNGTDPATVCQLLAIDTNDQVYDLRRDTHSTVRAVIETLDDVSEQVRGSLAIRVLRELIGSAT